MTPATQGGVVGGGPCPLLPSARTSCRGRFDDNHGKDNMTDNALFRNEARKRADYSRREFGGAGATGAADNGNGRAATATATDGIMFEWGGGIVLILVAG